MASNFVPPCSGKTRHLDKEPTVLKRHEQQHLVSAPPVSQKSNFDKPSKKLNPKTVDPFNKKANVSSTFASAYSNGLIPCRLEHGSVKHKLQWSIQPENLNYDPLLVIFSEGLRETVHPYAFVAHEGFVQLLSVHDAEEKAKPVLLKLIAPIKMALSSNDESCFKATLDALVKLSDVVRDGLNPFLKNLLPQISRRMTKKGTKEKILLVLQKIECNGGDECTSIIKSRIPTYSSVL